MRNNLLNVKQKITLSLILGLMLLNIGCFEKEGSVVKTSSPNHNEQNFDFPLSEEEEMSFLKLKNGEDCHADINCITQQTQELANEFTFKRGQLILRGPNLFSELNGAWLINSHINIVTGMNNRVTMSENAESEFHAYIKQATPLTFLKKGVNIDLEKPFQHKLVFSSRLGLPSASFGEPGFCNPIEADNFVNNSSSAILPVGFELIPDHPDFGFNQEKNSYAAETIILCGGFEVLNTVLHIEAKNLIFYNTHISVKADPDISSGLKIVTENLGYFGQNVIESNIINAQTERKSGFAPTIDISVMGDIDVIDSNSASNNRFNENSLNIYMAGKESTL